MSILVAILGLALLIFVHEAGHFFAALAVRMRPRSLNIGFGPAFVKIRRHGIDYALRAIPLGGYVKIPGMTRPQVSDVDAYLGAAIREAPELVGPSARLKRALAAEDEDAARQEVEVLWAAVEGTRMRGAKRGVAELRDGLTPEAYWRQPVWKRITAIFAGPATNFVFAIVLFAIVFLASTGVYRLGFTLRANGADPTRAVETVLPEHPAATAGLAPGDIIVAINGRPVSATEITSTIRGSQGAPLVLTVRRRGGLVTLGPVRGRKEDDFSAGESVWEAIALTGRLTKEIGKSLGNIVHKEGREQLASPVGIIDESRKGAERGWESYVLILAFISLSLALLNMLPLLPLDGGHIAFAIVEKIRGQAIRREIYERVSAIGIAVVLLLFFIGLNNDVGRLGGG